MKAFRGQPSIYASTQPADRQAELEVKKIFLNFGGVMALHDVDLTVHTGELVSVIGPNGAGKTSLMNCITGYYHPQKGEILFNGEEIAGHHPHEACLPSTIRPDDTDQFTRVNGEIHIMECHHPPKI